jgi:hypothetical protein
MFFLNYFTNGRKYFSKLFVVLCIVAMGKVLINVSNNITVLVSIPNRIKWKTVHWVVVLRVCRCASSYAVVLVNSNALLAFCSFNINECP